MSGTGITKPDNTDDRLPGDWKSKYEPEACKKINFEFWYLVGVYLVASVLTVIIWAQFPVHWFNLEADKFTIFKKYAIVVLGGIFGGTVFDMKWLIHAVANQKWHMDRRLWRLLVPLTSGAFSLAFAALITSGFIKIFDPTSLTACSTAFGFGFLVGYFSDNAIGKLSEVAHTLFGTLEEKPKPSSNDSRTPVE